MKKVVLLVLVAVLLSGCSFQMTMLPQPTDPSTIPTATDDTQPTDGNTAPTNGDLVETTLPEESFEMVNGVHATCENFDFTYYHGLSGHSQQPVIEFFLITKKPLPEDADITLPGISAGYQAYILDWTPTSAEAFYRNCDKLLYIQMTDPDLDITAYLDEGRRLSAEENRLHILVYGEDGRQPGENYAPDHPYAKEYEAAVQARLAYQARYEEEYQAYIAAPTLPEFHLYKVKLFFTSVPKKERILYAELSAGDMSRRIPMANVWLAPKPEGVNGKGYTIDGFHEDPNTGNRLGETSFTPINASASLYPYSTGLSEMTFYFIAREDMTLEKVMSYEGNERIRLEWVELAILTNKGTTVTAKWAPGTDMLIRKGEKVAVRFYYSDPYTELFHYGSAVYFAIHYRCGEEQLRMVYGSSDTRDVTNTLFEAYLRVVEGIDLTRYFREYFLTQFS